MKKNHTLDCPYEYDFEVLAINSHSKAYKLCWFLNKFLGLNLEITDNHKINESLFFTRYKYKKKGGCVFNLLVNRSKKGYMIPSNKSVNYFLIINKKNCRIKKQEFLHNLKDINDILLAFEFDLSKEKNSDRFIIHDKKN